MNRRYAKDYTADGAYTGPRYHLDMTEGESKRAKIKLLINAFALLALFILMGLTGNETTRSVYAGIPYMLLVIPVGYAPVDAVRFYLRKGDMERAHFEGSFLHMMIWGGMLAALSAVCVLGGMAYMWRTRGVNPAEWLFILFSAGFFAASFYFLKQVRAVKSRIVECI
jgi:hypothetical protein